LDSGDPYAEPTNTQMTQMRNSTNWSQRLTNTHSQTDRKHKIRRTLIGATGRWLEPLAVTVHSAFEG
jgi:hypothetical protein